MHLLCRQNSSELYISVSTFTCMSMFFKVNFRLNLLYLFVHLATVSICIFSRLLVYRSKPAAESASVILVCKITRVAAAVCCCSVAGVFVISCWQGQVPKVAGSVAPASA